MKPAKLLVKKEIARNSNLMSVQVIHAKTIFDSNQELTGYVSFHNTQELHEFLSMSDTVKEILLRWFKSHSAGFSISHKDAKSTWELKIIFNDYILKPDSIDDETLQFCLPLSAEWYFSDEWGYLTWVIIMFQLLRNCLKQFADISKSRVTQVLRRYTAEDWFWAFSLLHAFWWRKRLAEKYEVKGMTVTQKQVQSALLPLFLMNEDYHSVTSDERALLSADNNVCLTEVTLNESSDDDEIDELTEEEKAVCFQQFKESVMQKLISSDMNLMKADDSNVWLKLNAALFIDVSELVTDSIWLIHSNWKALNDFFVLNNHREVMTSVRCDAAMKAIQKKALSSADEVKTDVREAFWDMQMSFRSVNAAHPLYLHSCEIISVNSVKPVVNECTLHSWQVMTVIWFVLMKESLICDSLCMYDIDLSKTVVTCALILMMMRKEKVQRGSYKLSIIAFSSAVFSIWHDEIMKLFSFLQTWYYFSQHDNVLRAECVWTLLSSAADLNEWLLKLDSADSVTERTVFLMMYLTWAFWTVHFVRETSDRSMKKVKCCEDLTDEDDDEENELKEEELQTLHSHITLNLFCWAVCDEAHHMKLTKTQMTQALLKLQVQCYNTLSATFMINKVNDMRGALNIHMNSGLSEFERYDSLREYDECLCLIDSFSSNVECMLTAGNLFDIMQVLSPSAFKTFISAAGTDLSAVSTASHILSLILKLLILRKMMSDMITEYDEVPQHIDSDISSYRCIMMKVDMSVNQQCEYDLIHSSAALRLHQVSDLVSIPENDQSEGQMNMVSHCWLCHTTLHFSLNRLYIKSSKDVLKWHEHASDHELTFFFQWTKLKWFLMSYPDWVSMTHTVTGSSLKLTFLTLIALHICHHQGKKLLMFLNWLLSLWLMKSYLINLSYHVRTLRAQHTLAEWDKIVSAFNDLNSPVQILVTSLHIDVTSYNLQKVCHHMMIMNVLQEVNILLQVISWLFRIHQQHTVMCWIVTADVMYDGPLQVNAAVKFILQLTEQSEVMISEKKIKKMMKAMQLNENELQPSHSDVIEDLLLQQCDSQYQVMLRQQSEWQWAEWKDVCNIKRWYSLPAEAAHLDLLKWINRQHLHSDCVRREWYLIESRCKLPADHFNSVNIDAALTEWATEQAEKDANENSENPVMAAEDVIMAGEHSELNLQFLLQLPLTHCVKYADMLTSKKQSDRCKSPAGNMLHADPDAESVAGSVADISERDDRIEVSESKFILQSHSAHITLTWL